MPPWADRADFRAILVDTDEDGSSQEHRENVG
jgi:hypothetical protein